MPLLPEELARAQERTRRFFPTHYVCPLIELERKIAIRTYPFTVHAADYGFGSGTQYEFFGKLRVADVRYRRHFGREPFHMLGFAHQKRLRYEHREIRIGHAVRLEKLVRLGLYKLPYRVPVRTEYHSALDRTVIAKFRLEAYVRIPLGVIAVYIRNLIDKSVVSCHTALR